MFYLLSQLMRICFPLLPYLFQGDYSRILGGLRLSISVGSSKIHYLVKIGRPRFYTEYMDNELL